MTITNLIGLLGVVFAILAFFIMAILAGVNSEKTEAQKQQRMYAQCVAFHSPGDCRYILPEAN